MKERLHSVIPGESWRSFFHVVIGVWLMTWAYAALHDQYLIRIYPEHFTVWHYPITFTHDLTLLAIAYAFGASISPGLLLGVCLYFAGRYFDRPKIASRKLVFSTLWLALTVETCGLIAGFIAWQTGRAVYPESLYPDDAPGLLITQSIQITVYLAGLILSPVLLLVVWRKRGRMST